MLPTYELKVDSFLGEGIIFIQNKCKFPIAGLRHTEHVRGHL